MPAYDVLLGTIRCLLTTYGVPIKVSGRGPLKNQEDKLRELKESIEQEQKKIEQLKQDGLADSAEYKQSSHRLDQLQLQIARINGKETNSSVDSELSMVLFKDYDLYRWQPNMLKNDVLGLSFRTLMVSRLDGPEARITTSLIDKAIEAEKTGLKGIAYIDSRGIAFCSGFLPANGYLLRLVQSEKICRCVRVYRRRNRVSYSEF